MGTRDTYRSGAMTSTPPPPPPPPSGDDRGAPHSPGGSDPAGDQRSAADTPAEPSGTAPSAGTGFPGEPSGAQRNSIALTALILGLIAFPGTFVIAFVPLVQILVILTPVAAIVAIVLGIIGIRRAKRPTIRGGVGMSVTGIVLGAINLLLTAGLIVMVATFLRACPIDMGAEPEQATEQMLECMADQGWLGPMEMEELDDQIDEEFNDL